MIKVNDSIVLEKIEKSDAMPTEFQSAADSPLPYSHLISAD